MAGWLIRSRRTITRTRDQVLFTANYVKQYGWNNQWHGAPAAIANKHYAGGHLFTNPTLAVDLKTGGRALIGETGQPERLLGVDATRHYDSIPAPALALSGASGSAYGGAGSFTPPAVMSAVNGAPVNRYQVPITFGSQVVKTLVFEGLSLNIRDGDVVEVRR
jgi:hypothetical protein